MGGSVRIIHPSVRGLSSRHPGSHQMRKDACIRIGASRSWACADRPASPDHGSRLDFARHRPAARLTGERCRAGSVNSWAAFEPPLRRRSNTTGAGANAAAEMLMIIRTSWDNWVNSTASATAMSSGNMVQTNFGRSPENVPNVPKGPGVCACEFGTCGKFPRSTTTDGGEYRP